MLKLLYDLKVGWEDCYLVIKDQEFDLGRAVEWCKEKNKEMLEEYPCYTPYLPLLPDNEKELYDYLYDEDPKQLYKNVRTEWWSITLQEESERYFMHTYLRPVDQVGPTIWEPSNCRLVFDPTKKSKAVYDAAFSSSDACKLLGVSRQQLHYYVKTGKIKQEFYEGVKSCRYNKDDVYALLDQKGQKD